MCWKLHCCFRNFNQIIAKLCEKFADLHCFRQEDLVSEDFWWDCSCFSSVSSWSSLSPLSSSLKFSRLETRSGSGLIIFLPRIGESSQSPRTHLLLSNPVNAENMPGLYHKSDGYVPAKRLTENIYRPVKIFHVV